MERSQWDNGAGSRFPEFDLRTSARLSELGIEARFEPGELIFKPRDESGLFYFIDSGSVALEQPGSERPARIETLHQGNFLGWSALLGSGTRRFQARALTRVVLLAFDGELVRKTCDDDPRFGYALMTRLLTLATDRLDTARMQIAQMQKGYVRDWASAAIA